MKQIYKENTDAEVQFQKICKATFLQNTSEFLLPNKRTPRQLGNGSEKLFFSENLRVTTFARARLHVIRWLLRKVLKTREEKM